MLREVKITQKAAADLSMMHSDVGEQEKLAYKDDEKVSKQAYKKNISTPRWTL